MRATTVACLMAALAASACVSAIDMNLHVMTDKADEGALCLDGSPGAFYHSPAASSDDTNKWIIFFQGGGWCYQEWDCLGRSKGNLGSSTHLGPTAGGGGIMSDDCSVNPQFCNYNRVQLSYCDGASFSGDRTDPIIVNGTKLWSRGHRILDATLETLMDMGLVNATDVLLSGCSAGGLATYLHTDYVHEYLQKKLPNLQRFKAASVSGFFLMHNTTENKPVYPDEMKYVFSMSNATNGVNSDCIADKSDEDKWQCIFGPETYKYIKAPIFVLNSALDSWQTGCIYTSEYVAANSTQNGACAAAPGWGSCSGNPEDCTTDQIPAMIQYENDFVKAFDVPTSQAAGNGGFVYSCHTHCAASSNSYYTQFAINNVTMEQAVSSWWNAPVTDPASAHTYTPCTYNDKLPYRCNPTCGSN